MVENLIAKVHAWESEKGMKFLYNKVKKLVPAYLLTYRLSLLFFTMKMEHAIFVFQAPLLRSLEEYVLVRKHKEEEKRRSRVGFNFLLLKFASIRWCSFISYFLHQLR